MIHIFVQCKRILVIKIHYNNDGLLFLYFTSFLEIYLVYEISLQSLLLVYTLLFTVSSFLFDVV